MKIKTSETTPVQINYLAAKCEGLHWVEGDIFAGVYGPGFAPATDWTDAGPIIERERIELDICGSDWRAVSEVTFQSDTPRYYGPTPLIAAMRCYVASRLGAEVDVPKELCK